MWHRLVAAPFFVPKPNAQIPLLTPPCQLQGHLGHAQTLCVSLLFFFFFFWLQHPSSLLQVCVLLIGWGPVLLTPALVMSGLQLCQRPKLALGARLDRKDSVRWRVE